ncbi:MAG: 30S ribosome-binding factor RbfA [candidate division Zixibacteria bacterium]|jgi:ribosome-binding factor A|nr:30S ribosome-binding factor RbfA [candidate division Zixibacteria bacterium]
MREFKRQDRLRDQIKREIADILGRTIKNPRLGFVTITDVELSKDLKYAKVYYSAMGSGIEKADSARALDRTKGVVKSELAKRLRIRQVPQISYHVDKSLDYGEKIDSLLDQIKKEKDADE